MGTNTVKGKIAQSYCYKGRQGWLLIVIKLKGPWILTATTNLQANL